MDAVNTKKKSMQWNDSKDVLLMREILGEGVLTHKPGSQERGQGWQKVADTLNSLDDFHVTGRGIRDRIMNLIKKHRVKINKERNETGLGGNEPTEFDVLLEEVINISEDTLQKKDEEKGQTLEKEAKERSQAIDIRQTAMETMGQTKKRKLEEDKPSKAACSRRSNSDTMEFLREKLELDREKNAADREERRNQNAVLMNLFNQQQQMMAQQMVMFKELMDKKK